MPTYCTCWRDYPNESHKKANGSWKCKDHYTCIRKRTGSYSGVGLKTKCIKKEDGLNVDSNEKILEDSLNKVRAALKKVTSGDLYDAKGYLTKEGYEALETLEGLDLFWICDPEIKLVKKEES